jgi:hypothetical protein
MMIHTSSRRKLLFSHDRSIVALKSHFINLQLHQLARLDPNTSASVLKTVSWRNADVGSRRRLGRNSPSAVSPRGSGRGDGGTAPASTRRRVHPAAAAVCKDALSRPAVMKSTIEWRRASGARSARTTNRSIPDGGGEDLGQLGGGGSRRAATLPSTMTLLRASCSGVHSATRAAPANILQRRIQGRRVSSVGAITGGTRAAPKHARTARGRP